MMLISMKMETCKPVRLKSIAFDQQINNKFKGSSQHRRKKKKNTTNIFSISNYYTTQLRKGIALS